MTRPAWPAAALALGLALLTPHAALAESLEELFRNANQAYFEGDVARAERSYQQLVEAGVHDPDVYFNLAVASGRMGQLGRSVLYLERSLWLRPGDDAAQVELRRVRALLGKRRAEKHGEATVQTRPPLSKALVAPLGEDALAVALLLLEVLLFGALLWRRRASSDTTRLGLAIAAALLLVLTLADGAALLIKAELLEEGRAAVVLTEDAPLREGPSARAQPRRHAVEGQLARVLDAEAGHFRVRLAGGGAGWMKQSDLAVIRAD